MSGARNTQAFMTAFVSHERGHEFLEFLERRDASQEIVRPLDRVHGPRATRRWGSAWGFRQLPIDREAHVDSTGGASSTN